MRSRRPGPDHAEAVSRRLASLSEQLAAAREEASAVGDEEWWGDHTRVSPRPALHVVGPDEWSAPAPQPVGASRAGPTEPPEPTVVPTPGRHASRRRGAWVEGVVPETLRGRVALGPGPVAVVAVLVCLGLAVACWQVLRDDAGPPTPAAAPVSDLVPVAGAPTAAAEAPPVAPAPSGATPSAAAGGTGTVTVDVAGRVRRPGIVVLPAGSRVVDAIEEAGGARPAVDLSSINLARPLVDGEQVLVGVEGAAAPVVTPPATGTAPGGSGAAPAALVDLNRADQAALETLPQVGPVTAAAIIAWREQHGGFSAVTELLEVDGIGDATLAQLTPLVTV
ncbi:ComEA family DNA-binding protein [Nocardioides litoris]|uniref:ComEA family DNA-binding protein n=1 Tax=Nocardioides litoris TaxID=1926648 RepID=UPI001121C7EE|nr:ComEA family DNA-binding protein [Nocardioides litoris]